MADLLASRYERVRLLGRGGMGQVWLCRDTLLGRQVAVKELLGLDATNPGLVARFEREARTAATLDHPNVLPVFDFVSDAGRPLLVMAYVDGPNLEQRVGAGGSLDADEVVRIGSDLARALLHAHMHGILHRDVKPANVLLDHTGRVRLTDFGIARAVGDVGVTRTGAVVGTILYTAPEVLNGDAASPASDAYSLAALIYRLVEGHAPHAGDVGQTPPSTLTLMRRVLLEPIPVPTSERGRQFWPAIRPFLAAEPHHRPPLGELAVGLSRATDVGLLARTVSRASQREPVEPQLTAPLPPAITVMRSALPPAQQTPSVSAAPIGQPDEPTGRSHHRMLALGAIAAVGLAGGGFFAWQLLGPSTVPPDQPRATVTVVAAPTNASLAPTDPTTSSLSTRAASPQLTALATPTPTPTPVQTPATSAFVFPADAQSTCMTFGYTERLPISDPGLRTQIGHKTTCDFATRVASDVRAYVNGHPGETSFSLSAYSAVFKRYQTLTCALTKGTATCLVAGGTEHVYVSGFDGVG